MATLSKHIHSKRHLWFDNFGRILLTKGETMSDASSSSNFRGPGCVLWLIFAALLFIGLMFAGMSPATAGMFAAGSAFVALAMPAIIFVCLILLALFIVISLIVLKACLD